MHKEAGERRDFLPELVLYLDRLGVEEIVIEADYGSAMGLRETDYLEQSARVRVGTCEECFDQDVVVVLRCPAEDMIRRMRRGSVLLSMLHYPTRPHRVALLRDLGVRGVSLDLVKNDLGRRLVENMEAVGWNGVRAAFRELSRKLRRFSEPERRPVRVTLLGSGAVGGHAMHAAVRYGDPGLRLKLAAAKVAGVEVTTLDYELTSDENYMLTKLEQTDLLIDATQRSDPSRAVIPNEWVAALPFHSVILDLSVDPYDFTIDPPAVKGIEGIPEGNLDQYVFTADDPAWDRVDPRVNRRNRRTALSCYSWPGVEPFACMEVYGTQVQPVLRAVIEKGLENITEKGPYFERAVARADVERWTNVCH